MISLRRVNKPEHRSEEHTKTEAQRDKIIPNTKNNLGNIHILQVPEIGMVNSGPETIFEELMAEDFQN